jgi:probable HAF family extracellular repeat protein
MTFLGRFALSLILVAGVVVIYAPLIQAQSSALVTNVNVTFTTIDVPGAGYTNVTAINTAGDMVGNYGQDVNLDSHGFLYSNGTFTYFDYPMEVVTAPLGINDSGLIVGHAGQNPVVGFLYDGTSFTTLRAGNRSATFSTGINNAGWVVGGAGTIYTTKAFEMRNGHYKAINFPGEYTYAAATGINNLGVVVGWTSSPQHGYIYRSGKFGSIQYPGADQTTAWGINDSGIVVGWYSIGATIFAFAAKNGKYVSFSYPGAVLTAAEGINAAGQIVGTYELADRIDHGFVTSPITVADFP